MNDDFNNFFDDQRPEGQPSTPVYHTPEPKRQHANVAVIISVVVSIVMSLVVIINVLVLATLKQSIADQYVGSLTENMEAKYDEAVDESLENLKTQYAEAISEALENSNIVDDVVEQATANSLASLDASVGAVANSQVAPSVARLYMYTAPNANISNDSYAGLASGFLITDTDSSGTQQRYLVTNAHCVRYEKPVYTKLGPWQTVTSYSWDSYGTIVCIFEGDSNVYRLEVVAYGAYTGDYTEAENNQPDLALL